MRKVVVNEFMSLDGDVAEAVAALEREEGFERGLVDELRLMIDPLTLGRGQRIFPDDDMLRELRLVDGQVSSTGVFLATYRPESGE